MSNTQLYLLAHQTLLDQHRLQYTVRLAQLVYTVIIPASSVPVQPQLLTKKQHQAV